nr:hypothetical protein BaRGS_030131 [Batillaria attramentaria]
MLRTFSENLLGSVAGMHLFRQYLQGKCGARVYACWMHVQMFYQTRDPQRRWQILTDIKRLYMNDYAVRRLKKGLAQELLVAELLAFEMVPADVTIKESKLYVDASEVDLNSKRVLRRVHAVLLDALRSYWVPCYVLHVLDTEHKNLGCNNNASWRRKTKSDVETDEDGDKDVDLPKSVMDVDDEAAWGVLQKAVIGTATNQVLYEIMSKTKDMSHMTHLLLHYVFGCRDLKRDDPKTDSVEGLFLSPELKERLMDDLKHKGQSSLIFATQDVLSNVLSIPATQFAVHDVITFRGATSSTRVSNKSAEDDKPTLTIKQTIIPPNPWAEYPASKIQGDAEKVRVEFSKFKGIKIVGVLTEQHRLLAFQYLILANEDLRTTSLCTVEDLTMMNWSNYGSLHIPYRTPVRNHCREKQEGNWKKRGGFFRQKKKKKKMKRKKRFPRYIDGWPTDEHLTRSREDPNEPWLVTWKRHYSRTVGEEPDQWEKNEDVMSIKEEESAAEDELSHAEDESTSAEDEPKAEPPKKPSGETAKSALMLMIEQSKPDKRPRQRRFAIVVPPLDEDDEETWDLDDLPFEQDKYVEKVKKVSVKKKKPARIKMLQGKGSKKEKLMRFALSTWKLLMALRSVHNVLRKIRDFASSVQDPMENRLFHEYLRREIYNAELQRDAYTTVDWSAHPVYFRKLLTKPPNSPGAKPIPITINKLTADLRFWVDVYK